MKSRTKFLLRREAIDAWTTEHFGAETGRMARVTKAFESFGIDRCSFYKYKNGSNEPPVAFFFAVMSIAPDTNMWSLLEKVK